MNMSNNRQIQGLFDAEATGDPVHHQCKHRSVALLAVVAGVGIILIVVLVGIIVVLLWTRHPRQANRSLVSDLTTVCTSGSAARLDLSDMVPICAQVNQ